VRRAGGPLSQWLEQLGASTVLRIEVVREGQLVLHRPVRLATTATALAPAPVHHSSGALRPGPSAPHF